MLVIKKSIMLVKESISFERGTDPKEMLGIGQKTLIKRWLDEMGVTNYIINDDLTIDVDGDVRLYNKNLSKLPDYIQFGYVKLNFQINDNKLTTLKGCPFRVGRDFFCNHNQLYSLEYLPKIIGQDFIGGSNPIYFTLGHVRKYCTDYFGGVVIH